MDLVLVVALCEVYELEIERLLRQFGNLVLAFVLPYGGVYEVFVVSCNKKCTFAVANIKYIIQ